MTTSDDVLAAVRELRAENLDALGRSKEAREVRERSQSSAGFDAGESERTSFSAAKWVELAFGDLPEPKTITLSELHSQGEPDSSNREADYPGFALKYLSMQRQRRRITTVYPKSFAESKLVVEAYRLGKPVVLNLEVVLPTDKQRVVDFAAGLVEGGGGRIERVTDLVFLLTPAGPPDGASSSNDLPITTTRDTGSA